MMTGEQSRPVGLPRPCCRHRFKYSDRLNSWKRTCIIPETVRQSSVQPKFRIILHRCHDRHVWSMSSCENYAPNQRGGDDADSHHEREQEHRPQPPLIPAEFGGLVGGGRGGGFHHLVRHDFAVRKCLLELLYSSVSDCGASEGEPFELTRTFKIYQASVGDFGEVEPEVWELPQARKMH
jgi:hypothetical protein